MNRDVPALAAVAAFLAIHSGCSVSAQRPAADLMILGGDVVTMDPSRPRAEAVAVSGDRIAFVGAAADAEELIGERTRVIRLDGGMAMPAFIDGHGHLLSFGRTRRTVSLHGAASEAECIERVRKFIRDHAVPPGRWVIGQGWDQNDWPAREFPHHRGLSSAVPEHPAALVRIDGHAFWVNRRAMEAAGLARETPDVEGGEIIRDGEGAPSGILLDNAMDLVSRRIPGATSEDLLGDFEWAQARCFENGIVSFQDAGVALSHLDLFARWIEEGRFKLRLYAMVIDRPDELLRRPPAIGLGNHRLTARAVKIITDGALGSRGAWLLEDYSDRPGHRGFPLLGAGELEGLIRRATAAGYQVCAHAIGDAANRMVLDALEKVIGQDPDPGRIRFRVEHAQVVDAADLPRFARLGALASIQAVHATSDGVWAERRLGRERSEEGAYAWRSLIDHGVRILNGTDVPVERISPVECFHAAVTRRDRKGHPPGGWFPAQRLTREEALRAYTIDAAFGAFEEEIKGSLEPGKLADIAILSRNLLDCPEEEILSARVLYTIAGGEVVHEPPEAGR